MKALKVYESLFNPKSEEDISKDLSSMDITEIASMAIFQGGLLYIPEENMPLIVDFYDRMDQEDRDFNVLKTYINEGRKRHDKDDNVEIIFKYVPSSINYIIRQYNNTDFIVFVTAKSHPLWINKIYNWNQFVDFLKQDF